MSLTHHAMGIRSGVLPDKPHPKVFIWTALFALLILVGLPNANALDPQKAITQFRHRHWGAAEGIIQVNAISQTSDGYLWVATVDGLFRFNGVIFSPWEPSFREPGLPGVPEHLLATSDGTLFVAGKGYVLVLRAGHSKTFALRNDEGRARTTRLCQSKNGTVWVGTSIGLYQFTGGKCRLLGPEWGLPNDGVTATMVDEEDTLWLSVDDSKDPAGCRIAFLRKGENRFHLGTERSNRAEMLARAPDGKLWVADLVRSVRPATIQRDGIRYVHPEIQVGSMAFLFDRDGTLWITTVADGLRRVRNTAALGPEDIGRSSDAVDKFLARDGLSSDVVASIFEDREGVIWCGTEAGLDCFCETKITAITTREGLRAGGNLTVLASATGNIWTGGNEKGIIEIRPSQNLFLNRGWFGLDLSGQNAHAFIFRLYEDRTGDLVLATGGGVAILKHGENQASFLPEVPDFKTVLGVTRDREGGLWLCDRYKGVYRLFNGKLQPFPELHRELDGWPSVAFTDTDGRVWVGLTTGEVALFDAGHFSVFSEKDGLPGGQVTTILCDLKGDTWVAGAGGLSHYEKGHFRTLSRGNGLPFDNIFVALEDDDGVFWLAGSPGIFRVPAHDLEATLSNGGNLVTGEMFSEDDGLKGLVRHIPFGYRGLGLSVASKARDGSLWFATTEGLAVIDPHRIRRNALAPPVHIEEIKVGKKAYHLFEALSFPSGTRNCEIGFAALSFLNPSKVSYTFKLEGSDTDWRHGVGQRQASYSNLKPGHYKFQVCACNGDGIWNDIGDSVEFAITPTFFQTAWFPVLSTAAGGFILFGLYRYRLARIAALSTLKAKLSRATQIASFAEMSASIAHEINQPLAAIVTNGKACLRWLSRPVPDLEEARKVAQDIVADANRGSEVVERIRALLKKEPVCKSRIDINDVVQEILKLVEPELEGTVLKMELATDLPQVFADRIQLQQVLVNLINNAIDAMKPVMDRSHILTITTRRKGSSGLEVTVADSGVGLDPKKTEQLFDAFYTTKPGGLGLGLSISRSIIENHGGRLWAERNDGSGSIFRFTLSSSEPT